MWLVVLIMSPLIIWADIKLFKFYFKSIFTNEEDFNSSIKYSFTPDIFSFFRGEYMKDYFAELKLSIFIILCIGTIALEVIMVKSIL